MREKRLVLYTLAILPFLLSSPFAEPAPRERYVEPNLLTSEVATLNSFRESLQVFTTQTESLQGKATVASQEKEQVRVLAGQVKDSIPGAKQALESAIRKIKSDGKWTPKLDKYAIEQISRMDMPPDIKDKFIKQVKQNGGARAVLDQSLKSLSRAEQNINDIQLDIERKKSASSPKWEPWKCYIVLGIGVVAGLAGHVGATFSCAAIVVGNCF